MEYRRFAGFGRTGHAAGRGFAGGAVVLALVIGGGRLAAQTTPQPAASLAQSASAEFAARVKDYARALGNNSKLKKASDQKREDVVSFIAGNMLFVLLHELGHAAMQEMKLPILGREEDQADNLATMRLIGVGNQVSHRVLVEATRGWFLSDRRDRKEGEPLVYYDQHGLDKQRAYNITCLVYGSDPTHMADLAKETKLPEDRQASCASQDYPRISSSWEAVLKPHLRAPDQPKTKIDVVYGEGKGDLAVYADGFRSIRMLDMVAELSSDAMAWPRPFVLEWQSCGYINALWKQSQQRLTLCYELAQDFAELYRDFNVEPASAKSAKSKKKSK
jgi:Putative metallopeptidase